MGKNKVSTKEIEKRAVLALENFFVGSQVVSAEIQQNDRTPMWDGDLLLYNGDKDKNDSLIGRLPIQVKAHQMKEGFKTEDFKFLIKMNCLKNYLHEGIVYYVVQQYDGECMIFYRLLTPILLRNIIRAHKEKASASVKMYPMPTDLGKVEEELVQFRVDCQKQISFADSDPLSFEDLKKKGINSFSLNLPLTDKISSLYHAIVSRPIYLYANVDENVQIPIGEGPMWLTMIQNQKESVSIARKTYYESFETKLEKDMLTFSIGGCFRLTMKVDEDMHPEQATINVKRAATHLKDIIREAEFLLDLHKHQKMSIGERTLAIPFPDGPMVNQIEKNLPNWKELDETLDKLGLNFDIDLSNITRKESKTLETIVRGVGHNEELALTNAVEGINYVEVSNVTLWLLVLKCESGKYSIRSLFDRSNDIRATYDYPDGTFRESIYARFEKDWLVKCDNFPYHDVIPSFSSLKKNPHVYERANLFLLELIAAYDDVRDNDEKKHLMYSTAMKLTDWLVAKDKNAEGRMANTLNRYQLLKRHPGLTESDMKELKLLQLKETENSMFECGIALLLEDKVSFDFYWERMSEDDKNAFEKYPINYFKERLKVA